MVREEWRGLPVVVAAAMPVVGVRLGATYLRFLMKRKRGVRAFRRALLAAEVPRERVGELAQAYHEAGSIRTIAAFAARSRAPARD